MKQKVSEKSASSRVYSVRLPAEEANRVDALIEASGLTCNQYLSLCLKEDVAFIDVDRLDTIIELLRHLEIMQEEYMERLEAIEANARRNGWSEADMEAFETLLSKGEHLAEELFKGQRKAVRAFEAIRSKVSR